MSMQCCLENSKLSELDKIVRIDESIVNKLKNKTFNT